MQNLLDSHDTDRLASMIVNGEGTTYKNADQIEFNQPKKKIRLLLQVDDYRNGDKSHGWGPGGSLYFALPERGLLARNYATCEFDIQFT